MNASNWAVMVDPILAPMITPTDWVNVMTPAVIKLTTNTVVTDDELRTAVTKAPVTAPIRRLFVILERRTFRVSPAAFFSPSESISSPARNSARPPKSPMHRFNQLISELVWPLSAKAGKQSIKRMTRVLIESNTVCLLKRNCCIIFLPIFMCAPFSGWHSI